MGHYNYFRSYSAERGRYTQADPIGLEGGFNRFGYVGGNALNAVDPSGLFLQYAAVCPSCVLIAVTLLVKACIDTWNALSKNGMFSTAGDSSDHSSAGPTSDSEGDPQKQGRPSNNSDQNKQVRDAAAAEKLTPEQRRALGRAVEQESRGGGRNLYYQDILEIAKDIK